MKTKKFLIQFEYPETTCWPWGEQEMIRQMQAHVRSLAVGFTTGPVPTVTVILEECIEPVQAHPQEGLPS
jgi:hypothetical protein